MLPYDERLTGRNRDGKSPAISGRTDIDYRQAAVGMFTALAAVEADRTIAAKQEIAILRAFSLVDATERERELLDAFLESGNPSDALRAVGDPANWSRWQSLQRRVKRRRQESSPPN